MLSQFDKFTLSLSRKSGAVMPCFLFVDASPRTAAMRFSSSGTVPSFFLSKIGKKFLKKFSQNLLTNFNHYGIINITTEREVITMTTLEIILICITIHLIGGWILLLIVSRKYIIGWEEILTCFVWEHIPILYIIIKIKKRYKKITKKLLTK